MCHKSNKESARSIHFYVSHTNRSETLPSGKLASYHDTCHHLGLTKFCIESQRVVDDTRKHLSIELA